MKNKSRKTDLRKLGNMRAVTILTESIIDSLSGIYDTMYRDFLDVIRGDDDVGEAEIYADEIKKLNALFGNDDKPKDRSEYLFSRDNILVVRGKGISSKASHNQNKDDPSIKPLPDGCKKDFLLAFSNMGGEVALISPSREKRSAGCF